MNASFSFSQLYKDIRWFILLNTKELFNGWLGICAGIMAGMIGISMSRQGPQTTADAMGSMFFWILFITPFFTTLGLNKRLKLLKELLQPSSMASKYTARLLGTAVLSVVALSLTFLLCDIVQYFVSDVMMHKQAGFVTIILFKELMNIPRNLNLGADIVLLFVTAVWFVHSLQLLFAFVFKKFGVAFGCWIALWVGILILVANSGNPRTSLEWLQNEPARWALGLLFALLAAANYYWGYKLYTRIQLLNRKYLF